MLIHNTVTKRWKSTGLLESFPGSKQYEAAMALESQRLFNEQHDLPIHFKRISIPLVVRVFSRLRNFVVPSEPVLDSMETPITYIHGPDDTHNLDGDSEQVAVLGIDLREFIKKQAGGRVITFKAFGLKNGKIAIYS